MVCSSRWAIVVHPHATPLAVGTSAQARELRWPGYVGACFQSICNHCTTIGLRIVRAGPGRRGLVGRAGPGRAFNGFCWTAPESGSRSHPLANHRLGDARVSSSTPDPGAGAGAHCCGMVTVWLHQLDAGLELLGAHHAIWPPRPGMSRHLCHCWVQILLQCHGCRTPANHELLESGKPTQQMGLTSSPLPFTGKDDAVAGQPLPGGLPQSSSGVDTDSPPALDHHTLALH